MFEMGTEAWAIAARSALVYGALFVGLRLAGKRELGRMTVFDLAVVLLIANAVRNSMVGPGLLRAGRSSSPRRSCSCSIARSRSCACRVTVGDV